MVSHRLCEERRRLLLEVRLPAAVYRIRQRVALSKPHHGLELGTGFFRSLEQGAGCGLEGDRFR